MTNLDLIKRASRAYVKRVVDDSMPELPSMRNSVVFCDGDGATIELRSLTNGILAVYRWRESTQRLAYCPALTASLE